MVRGIHYILYLCTEVVESWVSLVATDREQVDVGEVRVHQSRVHAHSSCGWCSGGLWTEVEKVTFRAGTVEDVRVKRITTGRRGGLRGREGGKEREREREDFMVIMYMYV